MLRFPHISKKQINDGNETKRPCIAFFLSRQTMHGHDVLMQSNDPLHGITLETIVRQLAARHGWEFMGDQIPIRCFQNNPSVKSSLTFLRKTPWARKKVEDWYVSELPDIQLDHTGHEV